MPLLPTNNNVNDTTEHAQNDQIINKPEPLDAPKKRGRKRGKKRKGYFYEEQEEAFRKYILSNNQNERNILFRTILYPAFTKMIESIIRRYNLFVPDENFEDTFHDTMSYLLTKVDKFDLNSGYKVYSYCGTVCKNYLIHRKKQYVKDTNRNTSYDNGPEKDFDREDSNEFVIHKLNSDVLKNMSVEIKKILDANKINNFLTDCQIKVGYALMEIINNWEILFEEMGSTKFNRSSVLFFVKEMTELSNKDVRKATKFYKEIYNELKEKMVSE